MGMYQAYLFPKRGDCWFLSTRLHNRGLTALTDQQSQQKQYCCEEGEKNATEEEKDSPVWRSGGSDLPPMSGGKSPPGNTMSRLHLSCRGIIRVSPAGSP